MSSTVVSCPGKVLIAGGYLVLDRAYAGVVVSTSSRFYTVIENASSDRPLITVRSPQFLNATWIYTVSLEPSVSVQPAEQNESKNKFVHLALQNILAIASELKGIDHVKRAISSGIDISIVGDNDFYSQRAQLASRGLPRTLSSLAKIPPFVPTGVALSDVHKTGLGSSAALITSLVSSLLVHLSVISPADLDDTDTLSQGRGRRLAHNLAQYIHCLAQGKVGSGFDVSAAVFGSHIYTRFDPVVLQTAMSDGYSGSLLPVVSPTNEAWNYEIGQFQLPPLTRMMLADVDAGSDTPSLVGKVLKWRKEDSATSHTLWTALDILNQSLARTLLKLRDQYAENKSAYTHTLALLASSPSSQWGTLVGSDGPIVSTFQEVHRISEVRIIYWLPVRMLVPTLSL
ncbi:unnamed protein product [Mycena citricolor]|uniref:phosphomevalonate kinase n=1 Tax=Mycena citricolor TaxID=2018698 RepID=A0AAD2K6B5_9AGAR|nr:unnamed protein product [Mycena citricolor]CAK5281530.1 unnamed protein product [Mycena citricolor]